MKKLFITGISLIALAFVYMYKEDIAKLIVTEVLEEEKITTTLVNNSYATNRSYEFVKLTDDFTPENKEDLINIFYTVLNSGMDEFTFYCSEEYTSCLSDLYYISNDQKLLSSINGFISPYNSFKDLETTSYNSTGKVILKIGRVYTNEQIIEIDNKVNEILKEKITDNMLLDKKIKIIHDYIIENTKYDSKRSDEASSEYKSDIAYGPLFQGYGVCSGYSDLMMLFLNKMGIDNIKVTSENHIWNLVYINNTWLHLDLTWDDPVLDNGKDIIDYTYFLITTEELFRQNDNQHYFNEAIYLEAKSN